jgi:uncharacterized protein (DUF2267 family)
MPALGLRILDDAVHSANLWINEVNAATGWDNKQRAYRLLRSVLHALRDHLNPDETAQFAAQLPVLIRGIFFEGWDPAKTPRRMRTRADLLAEVQKGFAPDPLGDAAQAVAAVMTVLRAHVSPGEMADVEGSFTEEIRSLFI